MWERLFQFVQQVGMPNLIKGLANVNKGCSAVAFAVKGLVDFAH
jgi:hypothetical protein